LIVNVKKRWLNSRFLARFFEVFFLLELLLLDQLTKWNSQMRDSVVLNHGGIFGIFPSVWWGVALLLVWLLVFKYWILFKGKLVTRWALGLIMVGGLGNIIDRVLFGAVRDFIYYPWFGFYGNVADILLVIGVGMTIVIELHHEIHA